MFLGNLALCPPMLPYRPSMDVQFQLACAKIPLDVLITVLLSLLIGVGIEVLSERDDLTLCMLLSSVFTILGMVLSCCDESNTMDVSIGFTSDDDFLLWTFLLGIVVKVFSSCSRDNPLVRRTVECSLV